MAALVKEENHIKEENVRLQRRLLLEQERRENLGRQLSESESSLEMDDERYVVIMIIYTVHNYTYSVIHVFNFLLTGSHFR